MIGIRITRTVRRAALLALVAGALGASAAAAQTLLPDGAVTLPGRGLALAWSPDGTRIAAGGHFRDPNSSLRYDLRTIDVAGRRLEKSFACHYWWVVATDWQANPFHGEIIAEGAGDHAVKTWRASGAGSTACKSRGQFNENEGALKALYNVNGWSTALAFSPDGRWLAGASRDKAIRIWQVAPGRNQWKVVKLWYDGKAGNYLSVRWSPDGRRLLVGDRAGRWAEWTFDPATDLWTDAEVDAFAKQGFEGQPKWFSSNAAKLLPTPLWTESGHKEIWNVRYAPFGLWVAAAGVDGTVSVLESGTGRVIWRAVTPKATAAHGLDWSPEGHVLAVGAKDKKIYLYDAGAGKLLQTISGHADLVTAVAFSPDGQTLASTAGGPLVSLATNDLSTGPDMAIRFWRWQ